MSVVKRSGVPDAPGWKEEVYRYLDAKNSSFLTGKANKQWRHLMGEAEESRRQRLHERYRARGLRMSRQDWQVHLVREEGEGAEKRLWLHIRERLYLQPLKKGGLLVEEEERLHRLSLREGRGKWEVLEDRPLIGQWSGDEPESRGKRREREREDVRTLFRQGNRYRRDLAVRYAEAWWNSHNPQFRAFELDCTNYVSQCLYAGGAPMTGMGNRERGWWYKGSGGESDSWSYSWAVAHSLRWYLATSTQGLRAEERARAEDLEPGDVICYDFDGDGRWQHNAIVVAFDSAGQPLVNAHTANVRHKYWDYSHSYAYTEKIAYKFFHIADTF